MMTKSNDATLKPITDDRLWTARELAAFLGYSESTVAMMASQQPGKLPPRVSTLSRPRWLPSVVLAWVKENTGPIAIGGRRRMGRPRGS